MNHEIKVKNERERKKEKKLIKNERKKTPMKGKEKQIRNKTGLQPVSIN